LKTKSPLSLRKRAFCFLSVFMELNERHPPPFVEKVKIKLKNKKQNSCPGTTLKEAAFTSFGMSFRFFAEGIILSI